MISLEQARQLSKGDILYDLQAFNADDSCQRWKVNGKVKTWKRNPSRIQIPVKHGLYDYGYLTEKELMGFSLTNEKLGDTINEAQEASMEKTFHRFYAGKRS